MPSIRDDSGLSLTELLIVSVLVGVILAASYFMFEAVQNMTDRTMARTIAADEAQAAIDTMSREIRQSQEDNGIEAGVFYVADANDIKFTSDLNHDKRPELVRYYVEGGQLKRTVAQPTNTSMPFTYGAASTPKVIVPRLGVSAGPVFCYHSTVVNATALCGPAKHGFNIVTTTTPYTTTPKIAMVGIKIDAIGESGGKSVTVISRTLVRMRTVENTVE